MVFDRERLAAADLAPLAALTALSRLELASLTIPGPLLAAAQAATAAPGYGHGNVWAASVPAPASASQLGSSSGSVDGVSLPHIKHLSVYHMLRCAAVRCGAGRGGSGWKACSAVPATMALHRVMQAGHCFVHACGLLCPMLRVMV